MTHVRIQLKRTKGWRMPPNTVKVDRTTIFGNPFPVTATFSAKQSVAMFRWFLRASQVEIMRRCKDQDGNENPFGGIALIIHRNTIRKRLPELRGKNLACWCALDAPCHADVLGNLANK